MPVSHIGLTVSHLPSSCSFYLAALQPLGYRYIGQQENQIGFGVKEADFFICQDSPGYAQCGDLSSVDHEAEQYRNPPGLAHLAFSASSHQAVDSFYIAALKAGGQVHDGPAVRDPKTGYYSAGVIDLDGNAIEVVHRGIGDDMSTASSAKSDRMLEWRDGSQRSVADANQASERSGVRTMVSNIITTTATSLLSSQQSSQKDPNASSQALVGTLLGAAAGAAIAYAMVKSENEATPPLTPEVRQRQVVYQIVEAPPTPCTIGSYPDRDPSIESSHASRYRGVYSSYIRTIKAPPSPPSDYFSQPGTTIRQSQPPSPSVHTARPSETTRLALRPPPLRRKTEPVTHSVASDVAPSQTSRKSRTTNRGHSTRTSRAGSVDSSSRKSKGLRVADVPLPPSIAAPVIYHSSTNHSTKASTVTPAKKHTFHLSAADFPLPVSAEPTVVYRNAADFSLPVPAKVSVSSQSQAEYSHPTLDRASNGTRLPADYSLPKSTKSSHHSRSPADYPLPTSGKTSLACPSASKPRSASTVRPLTRAAVEKASTDIGDLDSVAPSDSISQVSHKHRRRKHKPRDDIERAGGSRARSAITEPARGGRSIATALGLGR